MSSSSRTSAPCAWPGPALRGISINRTPCLSPGMLRRGACGPSSGSSQGHRAGLAAGLSAPHAAWGKESSPGPCPGAASGPSPFRRALSLQTTPSPSAGAIPVGSLPRCAAHLLASGVRVFQRAQAEPTSGLSYFFFWDFYCQTVPNAKRSA